jgi:flavin reductase (DIM6/NTAB) family NADH-FMN oxidoreductase RutF
MARLILDCGLRVSSRRSSNRKSAIDNPKSNMVSPDEFKHAMRRWASTVTIITTKVDDFIYGLTVTSFSSLSANPPEVFIGINKQTRSHPLIEASGIYCVNFLTPELKYISDRFAGRHPDEERFKGVRYRFEATGAPVLDDALAFLDCRVVRAFDAGDHTIFIGEVMASGVQRDDIAPLLYVDGKYRYLGEEVMG